MKHKPNIAWVWMLWVAIFTFGCRSDIPEPSPTPDVAAVYTQAAQTLTFKLTLEAGQKAIAILTEIARATPTQPPSPTPTPPPTQTPPPPTNTLVPATITPAAPCNWAEFIGDVTVEDGTTFLPGTRFTKTWRIRNRGSCPWTGEYDLAFFDGERMDAPLAVPIRNRVQPGEMVDISVDLVAPEEEGVYDAYWMLRSASGDYFGVGEGASESLLVEIRVRTPSEVVYNFSQIYCNATWTSGAGPLSCPGNEGNLGDGFVNQYDVPVLETGNADDEPAILTYPSAGNKGTISGRFPAFRVRIGDHFRTVIGCFFDSFACNVMFQLNYSANGGPLNNLDTWTEVYDGKVTRVDIDLSPLAGKSVEFVITVLNNGDSADDWAFWLMPVIVR